MMICRHPSIASAHWLLRPTPRLISKFFISKAWPASLSFEEAAALVARRPVDRAFGQIEIDALRRHIVFHALNAAFAHDATRFEAAEGHVDARDLVSVNPHRAGVDSTRNAHDPLVVVRPNAAGETEHRIVGLPDEVIFIAATDEAGHTL